MYTRIIHIIVLASIVYQYILLLLSLYRIAAGKCDVVGERLCNRHRMYADDATSNRDRSRIRRIDKHRKL